MVSESEFTQSKKGRETRPSLLEEKERHSDVMENGRSGMVSGKGRREARGAGGGGAEAPGSFYARAYIIKEMNEDNDPAGRMDWLRGDVSLEMEY